MSDSEEEYTVGPYSGAKAYHNGFHAEAGAIRERTRQGAWKTKAEILYTDVRAEANPNGFEASATAGLGRASFSTHPYKRFGSIDTGFRAKITNFDKPLRFYEELPCVRAGASVKVIGDNFGPPKAKAYVEGSTVGVGAECGFWAFNIKGPNASAGYEVGREGVGGKATAELLRVSGTVGPLEVKIAPNVDTGVSVGEDGVDASFLGFGFTIGPRLSVSTPIGGISLF